jgi:L-malate glycosyltransferase
MIDCLFVGSFLSGNNGSLSVSEFVAEKLKEQQFTTALVSYRQNKLLRIADIVLRILFAKARFVHIEVYSGQAFRIAEIAAACAGIRKIPVLLTLHGGKLPEFSGKNKSRFKKLFSGAQHIATPSLFIKNHFEKEGYTVSYLPNSLDLDRFPYKRNHVKPFSLLWVRAFNPIYNPDLAVRTLHEIRKTHPHATLTMVGPDGGSLLQTRKLISELGLDDAITITGPVPNTQLKDYYQTHGVYLNTPSYESFGVALVEAASCGIPVVSTSVGEITYLWEHEKNMLLVNGFNATDFAKEAGRLLSNAALAHRLSEAAHIKASAFDWKNIAPLWAKLLNN